MHHVPNIGEVPTVALEDYVIIVIVSNIVVIK